MAYTVIDPQATSFDSVIAASPDLFGQFKDNGDYLKSAITDGAGASQGINTLIFSTHGTASSYLETIGGNLNFNGGSVFRTSLLSAMTFTIGVTLNFVSNPTFMGYNTNAGGKIFANDDSSGFNWSEFWMLVVIYGFGKPGRDYLMNNWEEC